MPGGNTASLVRGSTEGQVPSATIGEAFDRAVERFGERLALVVSHQDVRWTYSELAHHVEAAATGLLALGLTKGDRIGIWSPNRVEWTVTQYAAAKLGLILVNMNPAYRLAEAEYALNKAGCRALVVTDSFRGTNYIEMLTELAPELASSPPGQLHSERLPHLTTLIQLGDKDAAGFFRFSDLPALGAGVDGTLLAERAAELHCDDPINVQFTSGTTGAAKGATLSHRGLLGNAHFTGRLCHITEHDAICVPLPLYHVLGMSTGNLLSMLFGAAVVHPSEGFEPQAVLAAIERERCTSLYGVPTMFIAALNDPEFAHYDLSSLRTGIIAGAPVPMEIMRKVIADMHMEQVVIGYGLTETSATVMITSPDDTVERRVETVGRVVPHMDATIVGSDGQPVAIGEPGEICVRGYALMLGYWDDPERTAEVVDADGWFRTGDLGTVDEHGYARIVGRAKDMVIRGGENIYPAEVEELLHLHPQIESAQIIGVPDPRYGEELCAFVKLGAGQHATADDIRSFFRGRIAHFKIPRHILFTDEFPMTASGKVQKFLLKDRALHELGLVKPS